MILSPQNRKLVNIIRKYAKKSVAISPSKKGQNGKNYLIDHYFFDLPIYRDLRIADFLVKKLKKRAKILDWGCGYGAISFILKTKRPDLQIVSYDVLSTPPWELLTNQCRLKKIISKDHKRIDFPAESFETVIAVGVLEHVLDQKYSLKEIYRILKTNGQLFIFLYPNIFSYTERMQRKLGNPFHDKPLNIRQLVLLIDKSGFKVEQKKFEYMFPFMLSRFPQKIRYFYNIFGNIVVFFNFLLEKIPILNKLSSNIFVYSRKTKIRRN